MQALESKNLHLVWFDKRKEINNESIALDRAFALILNIPSDYTLGFIKLPILKSRHWISIKQINENFYNLDSKLDSPLLIGSATQLIEYLNTEMKSNDKELFIVVPKG
jgi:josephin